MYPEIPKFPNDWTWDELHMWEELVFGIKHMDSYKALEFVLSNRK